MPLDINMLREDRGGDPEKVRESQRRRFKDVSIVLEQDNAWRALRGGIDLLSKEKNAVQKEISKSRKEGKKDETREARVKEIAEDIRVKEAGMEELAAQRDALLSQIGNIVADDVPVSQDEEKDNIIVSTFGPTPKSGREKTYLHHHEVLYRIYGYEPERGTTVAGHRGYFLRGPGVRLNQALINYAIAWLDSRQYVVLQPPYFMNQDVMAGVAQLEQFDEELYKV
ncbi:unnamed protein product, partial [Phaeothamnion confervicola]